MRRNPVMVFAGEFRTGASGSGLSEGFRDLGWAVQEVDYRHYRTRSVDNFALRVASRITSKSADVAYCEALINECLALKPDIFLAIKGSSITQETLRRIKETGARAVMYYPDFHFDYSGVFVDSFNEYDLFITTKTFQVAHLEAQLGAARVAYVPHGFCGQIHRSIFPVVGENDFASDILYAGNHSKYKQEWLEGAVSAAPDLRFHIIGNLWQKHISEGPLRHCTAFGERTGVGYAAAIQTAKINVAVHFGPTASGWEDVVSTRTFEIPACRGFMLHIDNLEVREFFEPGAEIDVFSSPDELNDKIRFYLDKPKLRAEMIERAHARCVPAYSYSARAKQISDMILS